MKHVQILAVVVLLILAGCGGSVQDTTSTSSATTTATTTESTTTTATTTTTTEETTSTPTTTTERPPNNPWASETVRVGVHNIANRSRDITPLVNETIAYWNNHSEYADYNVTFVSAPYQRDVDVIVEFVYQIPECGRNDDEHTTVGCASLLEQYHTANQPEYVQVVAGYTNESTKTILRHEFGHLLGIEHGEEPMPTMKALSKHTYLSQPNATARALPWQNETLSVYIDMENQSYRQTAREQVEYALSYYEAGADGHVPSNVSFVVTENASAADIVVSSPTAVTCGGGRDPEASCGWVWGYDTDTDDALEYYSLAKIRVGHQIDAKAVGWHVGYWLADAFGLSADELPPPFVDADYEDRRSEWWE